VGVNWQEQTSDEPRWLVVVVVGVDWRERTNNEPVVVVDVGEIGRTTSLGGSSLSLWMGPGEIERTTS
jgi:hypothetical protein